MVTMIKKEWDLVEAKDDGVEGEEQNVVSESEAEAKEGLQKKRGRKIGRKVNNENTGTVTIEEQRNMTMGVLKSSDDDNRSSEETEEGMVDAQIALATSDREVNGTNAVINNKEDTKENVMPIISTGIDDVDHAEIFSYKNGVKENGGKKKQDKRSRAAFNSISSDGSKRKFYAKHMVPDENGNLIKVVSNACHQCCRSDKGRVVRCQLCTRKRYCVRCMKKMVKEKIHPKPDDDQKVQYSIYILHVLFPILKRLNEQHIKEIAIESKIQANLNKYCHTYDS